VLDPRKPPLTSADLLQTTNNQKEAIMAVNQETTTVSATRPLLRAAPDPRGVSYPSSHLPSRLTATTAGVLAVLVGAWGGIAPYIGHAIRYSADGSATWTWNLQHGLLSLLPGAIAVVGGLLLIARA
jgi:hypothetical protein